MSFGRHSKSWSSRSRPTTCTSRIGTPRVGSSLRREEVTGFSQFGKFNSPPEEELAVTKSVSEPEKWRQEAPFRYNFLSADQREKVDAILCGKLPLEDYPELSPRIVRMFVSCTVTDMIEERNFLVKKIYPKLKTYCRERHGIEFQVVDLRFNVSFAEGDATSLVDMACREIRKCQTLSAGPSFVSFLGQRYGVSGLPSEMPKEVHDAIYEYMKAEGIDPTLLVTWYTKDINATPNKYVLQSPESILGDDIIQWRGIREDLWNFLVGLCAEQLKTGPTCAKFLEDLTASVLHKEIREAVADSSLLSQQNNYIFERMISDLDEYLDRDEMYRYVDLVPDTNAISEDEQTALADVRHQLVYPNIPEHQISQKSVVWCDLKGIDPNNAEHHAYMDEVGRIFYETIRTDVDARQEALPYVLDDELYEEVVQHWGAVRRRCETFRRREGILDQIRSYVLGNSDQPLVLIGEPGIGKTDVMAKASTLVHHWMAQAGRNINTSVIVRLCGLTPGASQIRLLLEGLVHQLAYTTDSFRHLLPKDFIGLKGQFRRMVQAGEFRGFVVLFLDGLEELEQHEQAHLLDWLPAHISNNVKIVVSTTSGEDNPVLTRLRRKIIPDHQFVEFPSFSKHDCTEMLELLLRREGRTVSFHQGRAIREATNRCANPLYIKLMYEQSQYWHSDLVVEGKDLLAGVDVCIQQVFDNLELRYGKSVVAHILGFLTASRYGITQGELEDMLSMDDVILNTTFAKWEPAVRRIPPVLLLKIWNDIQGYLKRINVDETTIYYWAHMRFTELAKQRYLSNRDFFRYIHDIMADYYLGRWCGTLKKLFQYDNEQVKVLRKIDSEGAACRHVPPQPLVFTTHNTRTRYNFRKLSCLPYHLVHAGRREEADDLVFFSYEWLRVKLSACGVHYVIADYNLVDDKPANLVVEALCMCEAALTDDVKVLAMELSGRLLPHYREHARVRKLIDRCDLVAMKECPLVPTWQIYTAPGASLQYPVDINLQLRNDRDLEVVETPDSVMLLAKPYGERQARVWDLRRGEALRSLMLAAGSGVYPSTDGRYLSVFRENRYLQTYYTDNGDLYGDVEFGFGAIQQAATSRRYVALTVEQQHGPVLIDVEARVFVQRFKYASRAVALSADDRYMACNADNTVCFHELPLLERRCTAQFESLPEKIVFTKDPLKFYVMCQNKDLKSVKVNLTYKRATLGQLSRDLEMQTFALSHSHDRLLIRASRALFVYDTRTDKRTLHLNRAPSGVFLDKLSVFRDAAFTADDALVVAARLSYLLFWDATTGEPLRVLQPSLCPITRLYAPAAMNKVVTLLSDQTVQVWNLDDLGSEARRDNTILRGPVVSMAVSPQGQRAFVASNQRTEAMSVSMTTGRYEDSVEHTDEGVGVIQDVLISPSGRFGVTRMANADVLDTARYWEKIREDKLWDLDTGEMVHMVTDNRHVVFSANDSRVVFFRCRSYSPLNWAKTSYDAVILNAGDSEADGYVLEIPDGDIVGQPVLAGNGDYLIFILQQNRSSTAAGSDISAYMGYNASSMRTSRVSSPPRGDIILCVYSFDRLWHGINYATVQNVWQGANEDDKFVHMGKVNEDTLLLLYGRGFTSYPYRDDGTLDRGLHLEKGCILYNIRDRCPLQRFESFLGRSSNLDTLLVSRHGGVVVDDHLHVYDAAVGRHVTRLNLEDVCPEPMALIMDGKYLAAVTSSRESVKLFRTNDGVLKATFPVHGIAKTVGVASDDRTLVIGSHDGRVMMMTVVLDEADPVIDVVSKLPSRSASGSGAGHVIGEDIAHLRTTVNEHRQKSAVTRRKIKENLQKPANFRSLDTAVKVTSELSRIRSHACCIQ